jgi:hypothetical protein
MKTAMEELIEMMNDAKEKGFENLDWILLIRAYSLLEKEKRHIINAYDDGYKACDLDEALEINKTMFSGERYYNQNYNQNK